jgi:hypothetical protein
MISELIKVTAKDAEELDKIKAELKKGINKLYGEQKKSEDVYNPWFRSEALINGSIHDVVFYGMISKDDQSFGTYFFHYVKHNTWRLFQYQPEMLTIVRDLEMEFETDGLISFLSSRFDAKIIAVHDVLYIMKGMDLNMLDLYKENIRKVVEDLYIEELGSLCIPAVRKSEESELSENDSYEPFSIKSAEEMCGVSRESNLREVELDNLRKKWMHEIENAARKGTCEVESIVVKDEITVQVIREFQDQGYDIHVSPIKRAMIPGTPEELLVVLSWIKGLKKDGTLMIVNNCLEDVGLSAPNL